MVAILYERNLKNLCKGYRKGFGFVEKGGFLARIRKYNGKNCRKMEKGKERQENKKTVREMGRSEEICNIDLIMFYHIVYSIL